MELFHILGICILRFDGEYFCFLLGYALHSAFHRLVALRDIFPQSLRNNTLKDTILFAVCIFEEQLVKLADAMIDDELYVDYSCSVFDERIGIPNVDNKNWCGSGKMLAIDSEGNFHPCNRFVDFSLREKKPRIIGNVDKGIDPNKVRPFVLLDRETQSPEKCLKCEISKGCAWCQGENYDSAETDTIYQRSTAVCMMHKARVRANNYYWNKLYMHIQESGKERNIIDNSKQISLC